MVGDLDREPVFVYDLDVCAFCDHCVFQTAYAEKTAVTLTVQNCSWYVAATHLTYLIVVVNAIYWT